VVNTASFTYDWTTATNTTNYKLAMTITHPTYGVLSYSKPLAGLRVNPAAPSLAGLGSITGPGGAVNMTHVFGTLIMLVVAGAFSYRNVVGGIMAMVVSGAFLAYIGWIPTSTVIISGVAFIAIVAAANRSGG
jgi:hypothetical protein